MDDVVPLLVFHLDQRRYGVYLHQVVRVIRSVDAMPLPRAPEIVLGAIDLQGEIIPLYNVRRRFGLESREIGLEDHFIIARTKRRTVALAADEVIGAQDISREQIVKAEKILPGLGGIEGAAALEDGLILIQDLDRFLSLEEEQLVEEALEVQGHHG